MNYNCNGCLRMLPNSGVKKYCLDNNRGVKMYCLLCPECSYTQFSSKERTGVFPLLALQGAINPGEIKTPEFKRHEETEARIQQEQIQNQQQQFKSYFNCDKCAKPIPLGGEKENYLTKYFENTATVSDMKCRLLCPPCNNGFTKDLGGTKIDPGEIKYIEKSPTFMRYQEHREKLEKGNSSIAKIN